MLERTAAGLESCSLQRVVAKPVKRCRRLHTGFWQHGASAIDMTSVWPGLLQDNEPEAAQEAPISSQLQSGLIASAFLLDFLYPTSTLPLLRRMYPSLPRPQDGNSTSSSSSRRPFSSMAPATIVEPTSSFGDSCIGFSGSNSGQTEVAYRNSSTRNNQSSSYAHFDKAHAEDARPTSILDSPLTRKAAHLNDKQGIRQLRRLLEDPQGKLYAEIWDLYLHLDHDNRVPVRGKVLQYLARSSGFVETGRAASVFRQIPVDQWSTGIMAAGVIVTLRAADLSQAVKVFMTGLEAKGLCGGLDQIILKSITSRHWDTLLNVWIAYYTVGIKDKWKTPPDTSSLQILDTMHSLGRFYFAFRSYLATDGKDYHDKIQDDPVSKQAFDAFDKYFTRMVLWEPCTPEQATTILEFKQDAGLYNIYLERMFDRWYEKYEPRSEILKLPKIYQSSRELRGATPSRAVLRGMFKINAPNNLAGLDQVYRDFIRFHGTLGIWGYEKFMKVAADRGDVRTVRRLWEQYVAEFPNKLRTQRGFRSILNVHASNGDVAGVEQQFEEMINEYKVKPDISSWNVVLKAYMRSNDYEGTLKCFDRICKHLDPDSFTFAHAMAMASKKGDLETTLDYFRRSQAANVPLSPEMAMALVVAYCLNDLLIEAESLCVELATRKLINTDIWNQLINFSGLKADLTKCYQLLDRMEKLGLEPNADTYGFLLQPLLKANRVHDAYGLLTNGENQGLFTVTAEHYAAVMVTAARVGDHSLVETLHKRLQQRDLPETFTALVALVDSAVKRKPGVSRTRNLSQELIGRFREAVAVANAPMEGDGLGISDQDVNELRQRNNTVGRAVMLLVQLRDFVSLEELMTLYTELFLQNKKDDSFPVDVVSALMVAYYHESQYEKVVELWNKTLPRIQKAWMKPGEKKVYARHEYDLSRVVPVLFRSFRRLEDSRACADCIDTIHSMGFKLTLSGWVSAITALVRTGEWERAMYFCETMLMPGWRGWGAKPAKLQVMRNRAMLKAPERTIHLLSLQWLKMRKMAAWSREADQALRNVEKRFPRITAAFERMEYSEKNQVRDNGKESPRKDLDFMLKNMSYADLKKVKEVLLKQLMQERRKERTLGLSREDKSEKERAAWKRALHNKIQRYATTWAKRREDLQLKTSGDLTLSPDTTLSVEEIAEEANETTIEEIAELQDTDKGEVEERKGYWDKFWERYDLETPEAALNAGGSRERSKDIRSRRRSPMSIDP